LNAGLNVALIPTHGALGSAIALVAAETFLCCAQLLIIHRNLFPIPAARLAIAPLATGIAAVPIGALVAAILTPFAGGLIGGAVWLTLLLLARYVTLGELSPLSASLARQFGSDRSPPPV
jgi:O-antigen/teichoic acid export membrane protein